MDKNLESLISDMKKVSLPEIDVTERVMNEIHGNRLQRKQTWIRKPVWIAATLLIFATMSVSAAVLPVEWNGISISIINDGGKNERIDLFKEKIFGPSPTYKDLIEDTLKHSKNMQKTLTLDEAQKEFAFSILRPSNTDIEPYRSIGALMNATTQQEDGSTKITGYNSVFHDFYQMDTNWVVVTQSMDEAATKFLNGEIDSMSAAYIGEWEHIKVTDTVMAMFKEGRKANTLELQQKTKENVVIQMKVIGDVPKEKLIKVAEWYVGAK